MTWLDEQRVLRDVLLSTEPAEGDLRRLGGHAPRWLVYRRMVRARFADVLGEGFEHLRTAVGAAPFAALVDRFLAVRPPTSPYLRDVPAEFLQFLEGLPNEDREALPPFALDLARFECAELAIGHAPEPAERAEIAPLDLHLHAVLSPSARLLEFAHDLSPLIVEGRATGDAADGVDVPPRRAWAVCVYRDPKTQDVEFLELTPLAARIVRGIGEDEDSLVEIAKSAAIEGGAAIDASFVDALSTLLADLVERGVLLGSRARAG